MNGNSLSPNKRTGSTPRLKYHLKALYSGGTPDTGTPEYWSSDESGVPWVAIGDMSGRERVETTEKRITELGRQSRNLSVLPAGTLIYSMYATLGHVAELAIDATINQALLGFDFKLGVEKQYVKWQLRYLQPRVVEDSRSSTQDNLSAERVRNLAIPMPVLAQQRAIADYLDRETARLDALVAAKERVLGLLAEKRRALITRAVTRGLDPRAPLRDSGIPWLGEVPAHWETKRAKWLFRERDTRSETGEEILLSLRMERGLVPHNDVSVKQTQPDELVGYKKVSAGEIVVNRMRAAIGLVAVAPQDGLVSPDYAVFRASDVANADYFTHLFKTELMQTVFRSESTGLGTGSSGFLRLYSESFLSLWLPCPSMTEQTAILEHINKSLVQLDAVRIATECTVSLLKERRAALIAAAVTGQLSVADNSRHV